MRYYSIIAIICFFTSSLCGQQPRIDSIGIDESKGILNISGSFGKPLGLVEVDSVQMVIINWADSLITVNIPDTGKGCAGKVVVASNGFQSNAKTISKWREQVSFEQQVYYQSDGTTQTNGDDFFLSWRYDLESFLRGGNKSILFSGMRTSHKISTATSQNPSKPFDTTVNYYHNSNGLFRYSVQYLTLENKFIVPEITESIVDGEHINNFICLMDSTFNILAGHNDGQFTLGYYRFEWVSSNCDFPPIRIPSNVKDVIEEENYLRCYPNPASDYITIKSEKPIALKIYDVAGKEFYHGITNSIISTKDFTIGFYSALTKDARIVKFIIKK